MNENETRRLLRQWDPAAGVEPPTEELYAALRARLASTGKPTASPRSGGWLASRWSLAAVTVAGALLVAVTVSRLQRSPSLESSPPRPNAAVEAIALEGDDVQVVYTASNGVRVYWSVPADASRL